MEEATKTGRIVRPGIGRRTESSSSHTREVSEEKVQEKRSTDERTKDRWFLEERGGKRVPKRLDIPNEVMVTSGGPLKATGNLTLVGEDGSTTHAVQLDLCRCGASRNKPLCDEQCIEIEFLDKAAISQASDTMPTMVPQVLKITCIKDGPLQLKGLVRIFNRKGQQLFTTSGNLCRCGKSSKKPFCDCL